MAFSPGKTSQNYPYTFPPTIQHTHTLKVKTKRKMFVSPKNTHESLHSLLISHKLSKYKSNTHHNSLFIKLIKRRKKKNKKEGRERKVLNFKLVNLPSLVMVSYITTINKEENLVYHATFSFAPKPYHNVEKQANISGGLISRKINTSSLSSSTSSSSNEHTFHHWRAIFKFLIPKSWAYSLNYVFILNSTLSFNLRTICLVTWFVWTRIWKWIVSLFFGLCLYF